MKSEKVHNVPLHAVQREFGRKRCAVERDTLETCAVPSEFCLQMCGGSFRYSLLKVCGTKAILIRNYAVFQLRGSASTQKRIAHEDFQLDA